MYYPEFSEFEKLCRVANLIPLYREILADLETPVSAFMKLQSEKEGLEEWRSCAYLLESVEKGERLGRYSFLGIDPFLVFQSKADRCFLFSPNKEVESWKIESDPLSELRQIMQRFRVANLPHLPIFLEGQLVISGMMWSSSGKKFLP